MPKDLTPQKIIGMLLRHIKLIFLIAVLVTLIAYGYSTFFITPVYSASSTIHIWYTKEDFNQYATQATSVYGNRRADTGGITASASLASNCVILFQQSPMMTQYFSSGSVSISQVSESNVIQFSVTSSNPKICSNVANQLADAAPECFESFFGDVGTVKTIRTATEPTSPISPNINRNTMIGAIIGFIIGVLLAFFLEIIDTTLKPGDDLAKLYGLPVFAEIVDFEKEG